LKISEFTETITLSDQSHIKKKRPFITTLPQSCKIETVQINISFQRTRMIRTHC